MADEEGNFDDWLASELRKELAPHTMRPLAAPRYRIRSRGRRRGLSLFTGTSAALGAKAMTGFVATAFAVVATGAAVTGSTNPAVWGAAVRTAVSDCKSDLNHGQRGWGDCVNSVAGQVQAQAPAPVVQAPAPASASGSRFADTQGPAVTAPVAPKIVKVPDPGKTIVPPRPARATPRPTPTPTPDDENAVDRRG